MENEMETLGPFKEVHTLGLYGAEGLGVVRGPI